MNHAKVYCGSGDYRNALTLTVILGVLIVQTKSHLPSLILTTVTQNPAGWFSVFTLKYQKYRHTVPPNLQRFIFIYRDCWESPSFGNISYRDVCHLLNIMELGAALILPLKDLKAISLSRNHDPVTRKCTHKEKLEFRNGNKYKCLFFQWSSSVQPTRAWLHWKLACASKVIWNETCVSQSSVWHVTPHAFWWLKWGKWKFSA